MIKRGISKTLAEVGKIKTGYKGKTIKSKNGNSFQPPKKLDHFIITTTIRDKDTGNLLQDSSLMDNLEKDTDNKIREIKIRLPFDSIDKNFFTQYQAYSSRKCICRGDGEKARRVGKLSFDKNGKKIISEGDEIKEVPCDPETCPFLAANMCKVSGILSAFIPESGIFGGVYKLRTHSYNAVASILGALEYISENTGGILQNLPLKLKILKKTTDEHGDVIYPTVVLDLNEMQKLRNLALEEKRSRAEIGYDIKMVEEQAVQSGFFRETDTEEEIAAEFYVEEESEKEPEKKNCSPAELAKMIDPAPVKKKTEEPKTQDLDFSEDKKTEPEPESVIVGASPIDIF